MMISLFKNLACVSNKCPLSSASVRTLYMSSKYFSAITIDGNEGIPAVQDKQKKAADKFALTPVEKSNSDYVEAMAAKKRIAEYANNPKALMEFFDDPAKWGDKEVRSGRPWRLDELRIKSNSDLHKLWFVLLKERNMLLTMKEAADKQSELFPSPERIDKVEESMRNLEDIVRERNKAYHELEVGEGETGEQRKMFRRDQFGQHRWVRCSEHVVPYWMNAPWRKLYGPGFGKDVENFMLLMREKKVKRMQSKILAEKLQVRQLIRRFPEMDLQHLQEKYPRVSVKEMKEYEFMYRERHLVSPGTLKSD